MTTRYVGKGGSDGNTGLTWAQRKLTIQATENASNQGDVVYIGPGTYREQITLNDEGSSGLPIVWIGDNTGWATDGVGGLVRITGSDDDITVARDYCVYSGSLGDYRTFRGIHFDLADYGNIKISGTGSIVEDCTFGPNPWYSAHSNYAISITLGTSGVMTVRRCLFWMIASGILVGTSGSGSGTLIENCALYSIGEGYGVNFNQANGEKIKNCLFMGFQVVGNVSSVSTNVDFVNNVLIANESDGLGTGFSISHSYTRDHTNTPTGGLTVNELPIDAPLMEAGRIFTPWLLGGHSIWDDPGAGINCDETDLPTEDLFGRFVNQGTAAANVMPPGPFSGGTKLIHPRRSGGLSTPGLYQPYSMGTQFLFPVTGVSHTVSVKVKRESGYTGTYNPVLYIIKPNQSATAVEDAGAANQWNSLSTTFTPSSARPYIFVELRNYSTNDADVWWDELKVELT